MTGAHLPPATDRELSALKVRVSDLERMLDRVRRATAPVGGAVPLAPFAAIEGYENFVGTIAGEGDGWTLYYPANSITKTIADVTGHLVVVATPAPTWTIRIDVSGVYELGVSVMFNDDATRRGDRAAGLARVSADGELLELHRIDQVAAAENFSVISGSRIVLIYPGTYWRPLYGDNISSDLAATTLSFWGRLVSIAEPVVHYLGSA